MVKLKIVTIFSHRLTIEFSEDTVMVEVEDGDDEFSGDEELIGEDTVDEVSDLSGDEELVPPPEDVGWMLISSQLCLR